MSAWSVAASRRAAEAGDLETWVHDYLRNSPGPNLGLSEGLRRSRRWWLGPILLPLTDVERVCGPEPHMEFRVAEEAWEAKITSLSAGIQDPAVLPPFICEYRGGALSLRDGSHRCEALRRLGVSQFWTLIWFNAEADYDAGRRAFEALEVKPTLSQDEVRSLLESLGHGGVSELQPIPGGQIAQTFSCRCGGQPRIVRFATTHTRTGFAKEAWLAARFGSPALPLPRILRVGTYRNLRFALSERIPGTTLRALSPTQRARVFPALVEILHALRQADISGLPGFGLVDDAGRGLARSWSEHLLCVRDEEEPGDFFGRWHRLFDQTFLERELFERVYERMQRLLADCPEERSLVHSNLGYGNLLAEGDRITGVIDWVDARYGDFLFDLAGLDLWHREDGHPERFRRSCGERGVHLPHFAERLLASQCAIALDALRFFAKTDQRPSYDWVRATILQRLEA